LKKGDNLPLKVVPRNTGAADTGKNQVGDRGDSSSHHDVVQPGKNNVTDPGKSDNVVADGPGHKTKKPVDTTKKITTIFRPHLVKDQQHLSGPGKIERNAIGVAIHNDGDPKAALDPKVGPKAEVAPPSVPSPSGPTSVENAATLTMGHPGNHAVEGPPKNGPIIGGTSVSRPGNLVSRQRWRPAEKHGGHSQRRQLQAEIPLSTALCAPSARLVN
jgi:hypothetical protein